MICNRCYGITERPTPDWMLWWDTVVGLDRADVYVMVARHRRACMRIPRVTKYNGDWWMVRYPNGGVAYSGSWRSAVWAAARWSAHV